MHSVHVVLAIPGLYQETLAAVLEEAFEITRILNFRDEWEIACTIRNLLSDSLSPDDSVVLITMLETENDIPPLCYRFLMEFPELTIFGICSSTSQIRSFQLQITVADIRCSIGSLRDAIFECTRRILPW